MYLCSFLHTKNKHRRKGGRRMRVHSSEGEAEKNNSSLSLFPWAPAMWLHVVPLVFATQICETGTVSGGLSYDRGQYIFPRVQK